MQKIVKLSALEKVVYFHEFIYFVEELDYSNNRTVDMLKTYFICLLLAFDRILIPVEHLNISLSDAQLNLKVKFMNSAFVRDFLSAGRIIFTKWEVCRDMDDYLEAAERYMDEIKAKHFFSYEPFINIFKQAQIYDRDQAYQSQKAKEFASVDIQAKRWEKEFDFLRYEHGLVNIYCSHEKAYIGEGREKNFSEEFINATKVGYITAMPDGNGIIFRSLVDGIETVKEGGDIFFNPLKKNLLIDPVLLKIPFIKYILKHFGFEIPKPIVLENPAWRIWFIEYLEGTRSSTFKSEIFSAFQFLSNLEIESKEDFYQKIKYVKVHYLSKVLVSLLRICFDWKNYLLSKFEAKFIDKVKNKNCFVHDAEIRLFNETLRRYDQSFPV